MGLPPFGVPTFSGFGPPPSGPPPSTLGASTLCGPKIQHPKIGRSRNWPKSIALERWGPKISRFFFPVPPQNSFFSSLSGGLLVEFWWCLKRRCAQMCTFGVLGLSCEAPAAPKQVLVQCAGPRCHHLLRTLPPSQTGEYANGHDLGMMQAMESLLVSHRLWAHHLASLPMRLGGPGLRSARRMSQAAYWASWADALNMIQQRLPRMAENIVTSLEDWHLEGCLGELQDATRSLDHQGFVTCPSWGTQQGQTPSLGRQFRAR